MTNRYFDFPASLFRLVQQQFARSRWVNDRFDEVTDGFDTVQTEMDLKAPIASPAFTGNPTAPTQTASDDSTRLATTAFVQDVLGAAGALLPVQSTHSGKFLKTNGTSASWEYTLPTQTSKSNRALRSTGVVGSESWDIVNPTTGAGIQSISASTTLSGSARLIDFTVSTAGVIATLPDATTLFNGEVYYPSLGTGSAAETQGIADSTGELLNNTSAPLILYDNSTAAGTWKVWVPAVSMSATGYPVYVMGQLATLRATSTLASAVSLGSDVFLIASTDGTGLDLYLATASGMSVSIGSVTTVGTDTITWMRLSAVTGGYAVVYATSDTGDIKAVGITVSGSTITASAATTVVTSISLFSTAYNDLVIDFTADLALVAYRKSTTSLEVRAIRFTGSSAPNPSGSAYVLTTADSTGFAALDVTATTTSNFFVSYSTYDGAAGPKVCKAVIVSVSGVVCTVNTATTYGTAVYDIGAQESYVKALLMDSTHVLVVAKALASTDPGVTVVTISGTAAPTMNANVKWDTGAAFGTATSPHNLSALAFGSYYYISVSNAVGHRGASISVSGTTPSKNGSSLSSIEAGGTYLRAQNVNGNLVVSGTGSTGRRIYTVNGSGVTHIITVADGVACSITGQAGMPGMTFKLSGVKKLLSFSAEASVNARVLQYGGFA